VTRKHRFVEHAKHIEQTAKGSLQTSSAFSIIKSDPQSSPELVEYAWAKDARAALKVDDDGSRDLRSIFERFNLDPEDPWSWRMLAGYMHILFSLPQRKRGRPVEYTPERLMQILEERESGALKNLPDSKAVKPLAKKFAGTTRKSGAEGLRKQLRKARSLGTK
jgi:hypothetical protein